MQYRAQLNYALKDIRQFEKLHLKFRSGILHLVTQIVMVAVLLLMLVCGVMLISLGAMNGERLLYYVFLLVLAALYYVLREVRVRAALKSLAAQGTIVVTADDEGLHAEAKGLSTEIRYESFCDLVHYKDAYYLYIDRRKAQILPERCFTEGDPAAFGSFIEEKTGLTIKEIK